VIAATNRRLTHEISAGRFREDLFYRIAVLSIDTPPLRERVSDIPLLVRHFRDHAIRKMTTVAAREVQDAALEALQTYSWPGNVRQLRHVVEQLVFDTCQNKLIDAHAVRRALGNHPAGFSRSGNNSQQISIYFDGESLDDFLNRSLLELYDAMRAIHVTHAETAPHLKVDRVALYSRLARARRRIQGREQSLAATAQSSYQ